MGLSHDDIAIGMIFVELKYWKYPINAGICNLYILYEGMVESGSFCELLFILWQNIQVYFTDPLFLLLSQIITRNPLEVLLPKPEEVEEGLAKWHLVTDLAEEICKSTLTLLAFRLMLTQIRLWYLFYGQILCTYLHIVLNFCK